MNTPPPTTKEFQEKLEKLEALMNELDLFIHIEGKQIIVCDFYHSVKTNGFSLTRWDFKRFRREMEARHER